MSRSIDQLVCIYIYIMYVCVVRKVGVVGCFVYIYIYIYIFIYRSMYGLERFGDFLVKLSPSKRPYRHKSIVMRYVQVELCNFLRVHDPVRFASLKVAGSPVQPHMVCKASFLSPTDWSVTGQEGRGIPLKASEIDNLRQLYTMYSGALGLNVFLGSVVSRAAWQVRGRIWTRVCVIFVRTITTTITHCSSAKVIVVWSMWLLQVWCSLGLFAKCSNIALSMSKIAR